VWLSGLIEFEPAAEVFDRVGQVVISDSSIWRRTKKWGEHFQALEALGRASATALPTRDELILGEKRGSGDMGVAMDGATVNLRQEGWKELKVGCVFNVTQRRARDAKLDDWVEVPHAVQNSYVTHLGGPERFGQLVWTEALRRGWTRAGDTLALGDGADWIWNQVKDHFYDSRQAVDWYHASQHLWTVAHLLYDEGTLAAKQWYRAQETPLFEGNADQLALRFRTLAHTHPKLAEDLRREAGYFEGHVRRMQYQELREDGWPIGSGMVESACKQFRHRFVGSGMRWSRPGIERLLPVRSAILSRRFDELWLAAYKLPPN
jgi:hypothetical protein